MPWTAPVSKDFEPVPMGLHDAICIWVIDLGLQQGPYGVKHQIYVKWELPNVKIEYEKDDQKHKAPMVIGNFYNFSMSRNSNLRADLEGWRGASFTDEQAAAFDISKIILTPCKLMVDHNEKGKAYVNSIKKASADQKEAAPHNEVRLVNPEHPYTEELPDWIKERIQNQVREEPAAVAASEPVLDDDIPF